MTVKELSDEEIKDIYGKYLKNDFPPDELKPLSHMYDMKDKGIYRCFGIYPGNELKGYACIVTDGAGRGLLDYFAVLSGNRGEGTGSSFMKELPRILEDPKYIIIEVEDPELSSDAAVRSLREKRISFYERAGIYMTGIRTRVYDAEYLIMLYSRGEKFDDEKAREAVRYMYELMFDAEVMKEKVYIS